MLLTALAVASCTRTATTELAVDLPVALDAYARFTPSFDKDALAVAGPTGLVAEFAGRIDEILVRRGPDQWRIELTEGTDSPILMGPLTRPPVGPEDGPADEALPPGEVEVPLAKPIRWVLTVGVPAGVPLPVEEGDYVWIRRFAWLYPGATQVRESLAMGRVGEGPSFVFVDALGLGGPQNEVPMAARPLPSGTVVYTSTGKDERACHRIVEHRAFTLPQAERPLLRPGESTTVTQGDTRWTVVAIDLAVTLESATCPERNWDRVAWLAIRDPNFDPLGP